MPMIMPMLGVKNKKSKEPIERKRKIKKINRAVLVVPRQVPSPQAERLAPPPELTSLY